MPTPSKTSKKDTEIFKQLKALDARDPSIIPEWLIEIKKDPTATTVINPLTDKEISTTAPSGVYNSIIKWCMETYKGENFDKIPNAQKFATAATPAATPAATAAAATAAAAAAAVAKPSSPDIFLIAKKWKENPTINPYTGEQIDISIDPQSKYVLLYQKIMNKLIKHILEKKPRARGMLTVNECNNIKDSLPNEHAFAPNIDIYYDYLFIKYFVNNTAVVKYNSGFLDNIKIYIYKIIFDSQVRRSYNRGDTVEILLIEFTDIINTSSLSINVLVMNLCFDIRNILYMHESKITREAINRVKDNEEILTYCISILRYREKQEIELMQKSDMNKNLQDALKIYNNQYSQYDPQIIELTTYNNRRDHKKHNIYNILMQIVTHCATDKDICKTLQDIYNCISKLYRDNEIKNTVYKYIKDPYNIYENVKEPDMPRKPQLSRELQMYKIRLNNLKNAVKDAEKDMEKVGKKPLLSLNRKFKSEDNIIKPQGVSMLKYYVKSKAFTSINNKEDMKKVLKLNKERKDLKDFEEKVEEIDGKEVKINVLNKKKLKIYDEQIEEWKDKLKEYEKDMEIYEKNKEKYDRLPLYEKEKVGKKPLLSLYAYDKLGPRKFNSEDNIGRQRSQISSVKYSPELKAYSSESNMKKQSSFKDKEEGYYVNDEDPYTKEEFKNMEPRKRKYVSDILYINDENKELHYQFDTVSTYNYILKCIELCEENEKKEKKKPINFYTNTEFTDANLDEICNKIKHFTRFPTYNSSLDIKARLNNCIYDNMLVLDYDQVPTGNYSKEIIGNVNLYLHINLGGILFRVINKIEPVIQSIITKYDNNPNLTNALNSHILTLPWFNREISGQSIYQLYPSGTYIYPEDILYTLNTLLSKGNFIGNKYFPYRNNNIEEQIWKTIMKVPKFKFSFNDTAKDTLDKLKTYQEKIQRQ